MKEKIVEIEVFDEDDISGRIQFDIELNKVINGLDAMRCDFKLLENSENGNSVIRFFVNKTKSVDENDSSNSKEIVPFQVAYAVSIHKAQGLEYSSVKIVITDEIDELNLAEFSKWYDLVHDQPDTRRHHGLFLYQRRKRNQRLSV